MDAVGESPVYLRTERASDTGHGQFAGGALLATSALGLLLLLSACSRKEPNKQSPEFGQSDTSLIEQNTPSADPVKPSQIAVVPSVSRIIGNRSVRIRFARKNRVFRRFSGGNEYAAGYQFPPPAPPPPPALPLLAGQPFPPAGIIPCFGPIGSVQFNPGSATLLWNGIRTAENAATIAAYCGAGRLTIISDTGSGAGHPELLALREARSAALEDIFAARRDLTGVKVRSLFRVHRNDAGNAFPVLDDRLHLTFDPDCDVSGSVLYRGALTDSPDRPSQDQALVAQLAAAQGIAVITLHQPKPVLYQTVGQAAGDYAAAGDRIAGTEVGSSHPGGAVHIAPSTGGAVHVDDAPNSYAYAMPPPAMIEDIGAAIRAVPVLKNLPILLRDIGPRCSTVGAPGYFGITLEADPDPLRSPVANGHTPHVSAAESVAAGTKPQSLPSK